MEAVKAIKFTQRNVSWLGGSTHFLTGFLGGLLMERESVRRARDIKVDGVRQSPAPSCVS
jgi:hypothetical protein